MTPRTHATVSAVAWTLYGATHGALACVVYASGEWLWALFILVSLLCSGLELRRLLWRSDEPH